MFRVKSPLELSNLQTWLTRLRYIVFLSITLASRQFYKRAQGSNFETRLGINWEFILLLKPYQWQFLYRFS